MPNVQPLADGDPRRLGGYDVTGRLGEGGQGVVYLGRGATGSAAVKLLHAQLIEDEAARARFVREVEVTKRVARFCTAQVLEAGMALGRPYIASEYVPGPSLHRQLQEEGPRRGSALDRLAINTATALAAIHQAGVVHRDFKPGNVLMGPDGPVVIDFGIARALDASGSMTSAVSQVVGTPAFMAPEQLAEGPIGPPSDMFAWGVTLVYAAGGTPAFGHRSIPKIINRILHDEPDLGPLDGRLREVVAACLAKDPARRPTARQLMDELMGQGGTAVLATPPGPSTTRMPAPPSRKRGRPALVIAAVAAVLVALVAGIGALTAAGTPGQDRQAAVSPSPARPVHPSTHRGSSPSRTPSHRPATPRPARVNPYTPQRLCGGGYRVIGTHGLGGAKAYLLYNGHAGANCVVTMVARSTGKTPLSASLVVKGGGRESRTGAFPFYAGPVRLPAKGKCVMWGGASKTARWTSGWSHCGR